VTLAREGANVIVHGRDSAQTDRVVQAITAQGSSAYAVLADLTRDEDVERLVAEVESRVGAVDILVNNAGGSGPKSDWQVTDPAEWTATYDRNVLAALRITAGFLPKMRQARWGRVINISSGAATMPPSTGPDYSAAKAAMNAMTASLAKAVATEASRSTRSPPEPYGARSWKMHFKASRRIAVLRREMRPGT
jgi:NAD(P)-dependent dehydrogenase (short-subunit alcohol dehydrogenase family)